MRLRLTHAQAVMLMIAVTLMWSTAGVVARQLEFARSFEVTFWRSFFTLLSLLVILPLMQGGGLLRRLREGSRVLWFSGLCWSVMFTAFMVALTLTTVANVLVTMAIGPLLTALVARIFIGHRLPMRTWLAILAAGAGIVYMFGAQFTLDADGRQTLGMFVALCVPVAGAVNWTLTQHSHANGLGVDLTPAVMVGAFISALATLPLALPFQASARDLGWLGLLGLVQLAIPCVLSVACARVLKAPELSLLALLEVVFGILLAWVGAHEVPGPTVLTGGAMVLGALVLNELAGWKPRRSF